MKVRLAVAIAAMTALPLLAEAQESGTDETISFLEARAIHDRLLTIDSHVDIASDYATLTLDPGGFTRAQVDLPKMRAGGLDAGFFIVYTRQGSLDDESYAAARQNAEDRYHSLDRMIRGYGDQIGLATTADEVIEVAASGRLVALIGIENAYPLGTTVDDVPMWAERGVTYVSLTHFGDNQFADSSNPRSELGDSEADDGLTDLGRELVTALNDHGIMVDISHVGKRSGLEALELSRAPVIASHSSATAVYDNARNLDDEQLEAIRDSGGVAQMVAFRGYVADVDPAMTEAVGALRARLGFDTAEGRAAATAATREEYALALRQIRDAYPDVTLAQFVDHIDHAVAVAGIDHVGLSGDFDGGGGVQGWDDASESVNVTHELLRRGYSEDDLAKLWGGNLLRVMRAVEAAATVE